MSSTMIHAVPRPALQPAVSGEDVRRRRKALGWTTTQLARRLSITLPELHHLEEHDNARPEIWYRANRVISVAENEALETAAQIMRRRS